MVIKSGKALLDSIAMECRRIFDLQLNYMKESNLSNAIQIIFSLATSLFSFCCEMFPRKRGNKRDLSWWKRHSNASIDLCC